MQITLFNSAQLYVDLLTKSLRLLNYESIYYEELIFKFLVIVAKLKGGVISAN